MQVQQKGVTGGEERIGRQMPQETLQETVVRVPKDEKKAVGGRKKYGQEGWKRDRQRKDSGPRRQMEGSRRGRMLVPLMPSEAVVVKGCQRSHQRQDRPGREVLAE